MINYVVADSGAFGFRNFIEDRAQHCAERYRILTFEMLEHEQSFPHGVYVIATDQLLPAEHAVIVSFCTQLLRAGDAVRVLNHPAETLDRPALLRTLHQTGRSRFRAVRATEPCESLRFPVFVRQAVAHTGNLTDLLYSHREVQRALARLALYGLPRRDLLVVEFCDTADADGVYHKYSAYIVGDRIIPRCIDCDRSWMLKFNPYSYTPDRIAAELDYIRTNPHEAMLREVFALARVQYGRMDYALADGALQAWEINLNPTIGRAHPLAEDPPEVRQTRVLRREAQDVFYGRFLDAWEALDTQTPACGTINVRLDRRLWDAARAERARWQWGERHRALVRWAAQQRVVRAVWQHLRSNARRDRVSWLP